jgi:hypothetical protein
MSSSPTKTTFFRRLVFAAAPLVVLLLVWPAKAGMRTSLVRSRIVSLP